MKGDAEVLHELCEQVARLEERFNALLNNELVHLKERIDQVHTIVERMANRGTRPTWAVVALVTFLSSLSVALLTLVLRR